MKKILTIAALLVCALCMAQTTSEEFREKYDRQVRNVGYDGVGVETILDNWEEAFPGDVDARLGRFYFYLHKSQESQMVVKDRKKYLGNAPAVTLKDEQGNPVNYFEEVFFDDECFAESQRVIDALIKEYPHALDYRCAKINSMLAYEKEDPTMSTVLINDVIGINNSKHPAWTFGGESVSQDDFCDLIQEYCTSLYLTGTESSYASFRDISATMSKAYPKYAGFLDNQGSYLLVCQRNYKKAISFYDKALKIDPQDQAAISNKRLAEREMAKAKNKGKKK